MEPMSIREIEKAVRGVWWNPREGAEDVSSVTTDSRNVPAGPGKQKRPADTCQSGQIREPPGTGRYARREGDRSRFSGYLILKAELYYFCATGESCSGRTRGNGFAAFSAASWKRGSRKKSANINI